MLKVVFVGCSVMSLDQSFGSFGLYLWGFIFVGFKFGYLNYTLSLQVDDVYMGHTALQAASQNGQSDVVKLLIGYKADLEQEVIY